MPDQSGEMVEHHVLRHLNTYRGASLCGSIAHHTTVKNFGHDEGAVAEKGESQVLLKKESVDEDIPPEATIQKLSSVWIDSPTTQHPSHKFRQVAWAAFALAGKPASVRHHGGKTTIPNSIFNLIKNIIGNGMLSLPYGIAAFGNHPTAIIPSSILMAVIGAIFGYYFHLVGRICKMTKTATYREGWENTIGHAGADLVALTNALSPFLACLADSMILADTFSSLAITMGIQATRTVVLLVVTVFCLLPLCLLKNMNILAPFSIIGLGCMVVIAIAMGVRCFDGSYGEDGEFVLDLQENLKPSFGKIGAGGAFSPKVLILISMLFNAYVAHYNAPRFYLELQDNTMGRFGVVVSSSFGTTAIFYMIVAAFGFLTFGDNCDGYILANYSTSDSLATLCRLCLGFSLIFTYPLVFIGCRDGILDILKVPVEKQTTRNIETLSVIILAVVTLLAAYLTDLGALNVVAGGVFGVLIVFVFPTLMFWSAVSENETLQEKKEAYVALVLMVLGIVMGGVGIWISL